MTKLSKSNDAYLRGKEIAQCGDFRCILETLRKEGLLEKCIDLMQSEYNVFFASNGFKPDRTVWETLTILGLYDTPTLEHCLRTFSITRDIATKPLLGPRGEEIILKEYIEEAGVPLPKLFLAAMVHDIGKIKLPIEILHNSLTDEEMNHLLTDMIWRGDSVEEIGIRMGYTPDELSHKTAEEIVQRMYERGMRPVAIVPLSDAFPEIKYPGFLASLEGRGLGEKQTIKSAAKVHESEGQKIFEELGDPIVADLVGHHHNYQKKAEHEMSYIMKIPMIKSHGQEAFFGVYNIIKIADSMDSLQSERSYKKGMSKIAALAELAHQAMTRRIEKSITYLWVNTEYSHIKDMMNTIGVSDYGQHNKAAVDTIQQFLDEANAEFDRRYVDRLPVSVL
ncbi:MAG: HD domain-containing protein [Candidatus Paceibacterota bacterium]|jgi:hypothetical protein|nr:hypothetical protein [Candidatus Paceibacterota bacterium]